MMKFYKYQGAGNDFVLADMRGVSARLSEEVVRRLCDRRFGIGADGFMALEDDRERQFYMRYYNADGRESTMCGNGGRCIALFAHHLGIGGALKEFNASDGYHTAEIKKTEGLAGTVRLKMADVRGYEKIAEGVFFLNTGSPHYIEFVDDLDRVDVFARGREIRYSERFSPGGTNVNFVQITGPENIRMRTYERGVEAETLACGTGATASAIAASLLSGHQTAAEKTFGVRVEGGMLEVSFTPGPERTFTSIYLEGPAGKVFECEIEI